MSQAEYKLLFGATPATKDQLARLETITVVQEVNRPWQARLAVSVCLDAQGSWTDDNDPFMQISSRIRIEVKVGDAAFTPLIDGPVVGFDSDRRSAPGQSTVTVVVHDDTALMHQTATVASFAPGAKDSDIARQLFANYAGMITPDHIETTPAPTNAQRSELRQRGTDIQLLRQLAQRNDFVCGVVPTSVPAVSSGIFHSLKVFTDTPPALVLLGAKRNIEAFDVRLNAQGQSNVVASTLSFSNKQVVTRRSQLRDIGMAGEELLPPGNGEDVDLQHRVDREASRRNRPFEATGSVRQACYPGVLVPLRNVPVQLGATSNSAEYTIAKVTHQLGRSDYRQDFTLVAETLSDSAAGGGLIPAGLF
jgi:phage protein D